MSIIVMESVELALWPPGLWAPGQVGRSSPSTAQEVVWLRMVGRGDGGRRPIHRAVIGRLRPKVTQGAPENGQALMCP